MGFNAINGGNKKDPFDDYGHGTTMAGVIAGSGKDGGAVGVNWDNVSMLRCLCAALCCAVLLCCCQFPQRLCAVLYCGVPAEM